METKQSNSQFITYLLGAGASAEALPIVEDTSKRLIEFKVEIENILYPPKKLITTSNLGKKNKNKILTDLDWLIENVENHASIDTFAKKLFVTKKLPELIKLKKLSSLFYIFEQVDKVDKRYDSFIASIIDSDGRLSDKVRIISWNYDYQFEKAFSEYMQSWDLNIIQGKLSVSPSPNKKNPSSFQSFPDEFCLVKLNGTTAFEDTKLHSIHNPVSELNKRKSEIDFKNIFEKYYSFPHLQSLMSFAWEYDILPGYDKIKSILNKTKSMVIIGYSFPFFNREVDKNIFKELQNKRIYIQDKDPDRIEAHLKGIIKIHDNKEIIKIKEVDQFHLPYEL